MKLTAPGTNINVYIGVRKLLQIYEEQNGGFLLIYNCLFG
jgi:hypothetical protein